MSNAIGYGRAFTADTPKVMSKIVTPKGVDMPDGLRNPKQFNVQRNHKDKYMK